MISEHPHLLDSALVMYCKLTGIDRSLFHIISRREVDDVAHVEALDGFILSHASAAVDATHGTDPAAVLLGPAVVTALGRHLGCVALEILSKAGLAGFQAFCSVGRLVTALKIGGL